MWKQCSETRPTTGVGVTWLHPWIRCGCYLNAHLLHTGSQSLCTTLCPQTCLRSFASWTLFSERSGSFSPVWAFEFSLLSFSFHFLFALFKKFKPSLWKTCIWVADLNAPLRGEKSAKNSPSLHKLCEPGDKGHAHIQTFLFPPTFQLNASIWLFMNFKFGCT